MPENPAGDICKALEFPGVRHGTGVTAAGKLNKTDHIWLEGNEVQIKRGKVISGVKPNNKQLLPY